MYSMSNLIFALIIGGGIGGVVGWYLALNARGDNKRKVIMDLESQIPPYNTTNTAADNECKD